MPYLFSVWVTTVTPAAADALMVGLVRSGMAVSPLDNGASVVSTQGDLACLLAIQVTVQPAALQGRPVGSFPSWMELMIQHVLTQAHAAWHSIVVHMQHQGRLGPETYMAWSGPNVPETARPPSPQPPTEQRPSTTQPANPLDKMDAAIGASDK